MSLMPGDVVQAFAGEIASRDVRRLESYLSEQVAAQFDIAGELVGRTALLGFWRRLFQSYSLFELHILKSVTQGELVIAESLYLLAANRGLVMNVRAINVFDTTQTDFRMRGIGSDISTMVPTACAYDQLYCGNCHPRHRQQSGGH